MTDSAIYRAAIADVAAGARKLMDAVQPERDAETFGSSDRSSVPEVALQAASGLWTCCNHLCRSGDDDHEQADEPRRVAVGGFELTAPMLARILASMPLEMREAVRNGEEAIREEAVPGNA